MRYDIISDTHGYLSKQLLAALQGADVIVHAGDICSVSDFRQLEKIAEVKACLGNNDYGYDYGPFVTKRHFFYSDGMRWQVCHYRERIDLETCEIAISGHTHRSFVERENVHGRSLGEPQVGGMVPGANADGILAMNPGSPTYPRSVGPTIGRIIAEDGVVLSAKIIKLER